MNYKWEIMNRELPKSTGDKTWYVSEARHRILEKHHRNCASGL